MPETFTSSAAVELAVVERSGFIESRHIGSAAVMSADGTVVTTLGDIDAPIFPRSSLKPFQAIATLQSGVPLRGEQVALAAASHVGSIEHMDVVQGMLKAAGLTARELRCPADWPADEQARNWLVRTERGKVKEAMNCSGKHAGFLWACVENGWDVGSYLEPDHPLQRRIVDVIEDYTEEKIAHLAVDGCGAPAPAMTLKGLARGISKVAKAPGSKSSDARAATVATAMLDYPWAVHGVGEVNSVVMEELGIVAKSGAEGIMVMGTDTGVSVAVKMLDGGGRASSLVALTLLAAAGAVDPSKVGPVLEKVVPAVYGRGEPVGKVRLSAPVTALLD
ncbi:asparaginase [Arthrobacter castelli]|uniref:asparaginase n=1 Tax=Arthrobacter castelli TaxID=271431 RepID=UPI000400882D|nr:asparaginase [Arthrobacter castelli]